MWHKSRFTVFAFLVVAVGAGAAIYKWVDEQGETHYADRPPVGQPSKKISAPPTSASPVRPTPGVPEKEREFQERRAKRLHAETAAPPTAIDRKPEKHRASQYLTTTKTWVDYEMRGEVLSGVIGLTVKANREMRENVWLEVRFEIRPSDAWIKEHLTFGFDESRGRDLIDNPDPYLVTVVMPDRIRIGPNDEVTIESPMAEGLRCRPYSVDILIYGGSAEREMLGDHHQKIYGWIDGLKVRNDTQLRDALRESGRCVP